MSGKKKLLVVEDEPDHRLAVQMIFDRQEGFEVLPAADATEAREILRKGPVDLILLDIALPGETGLEFCERLVQESGDKKVPIIAISAFPESIWRSR